jgi:lysophospholipase L1-like esterase
VTASFLALGDSYTIGEGVAAEDRWPVQLAARLRTAGRPIAAPRIVARTGWTTDELLDAIDGESLPGKYDLVTVLAGVNDQYRGYGADRYRRSFEALMGPALALAKLPEHLIVLSIPDWSVTPFAAGRDRSAIAREIDAFNEECRAIAAAHGARFLDIAPASRQASNNAALLAADGLHPSATMYSMWVDQLVPLSLDVLDQHSLEKR